MRLSDILPETNVIAALDAVDKQGVLKEIAWSLARAQPALGLDPEQILQALLEREHSSSTGVGQGVAIPHARIANLPQLVSLFARSRTGVLFDAIDQRPVNLFFVLLVPESAAGIHLKALSRVARLLKSDDFRRTILEATDAPSIYRLFINEDAKVGA